MEYGFLLCAVALSKVFAYKCMEGRQLITAAGDPQEIFRMAPKELSGMVGGRQEIISAIRDHGILKWAEAELEWCEQYGIRALYIEDPGYPRRLAECCDAPLILFCKGGIDLNPERALAVVGTRKATWAGRTACIRTVKGLSCIQPRPAIISGLAYGIDAAAHTAALEAGMPTIAVIPCGLDTIYPTRHRDLAARIATTGAVVTDFPRGSAPQTAHFIRRNRIIAGMADATLLAESFAKGGGLITTSLANSYDREVFACPGRVTDESFEGCNRLIFNTQARLVINADDLSSSMGWGAADRLPEKKRDATLPFLEDETRGMILKCLERESPMDFERIMELTGMDFRTLSALLMVLEINGSIVSLQGRKYAPAP